MSLLSLATFASLSTAMTDWCLFRDLAKTHRLSKARLRSPRDRFFPLQLVRIFTSLLICLAIWFTKRFRTFG